MITLCAIPKIRDSISFLYFDQCRVEQEAKGIVVLKKSDKYAIPCANLSTLLLGPGATITHAAIKTLANNACEVQWVGEDCFRFYSNGRNNSASVQRLYHQVKNWSDDNKKLEVVRKMYQFRFKEQLSNDLSLQQIRGLEGVRVRTIYQKLSKETGVEWKGRNYNHNNWDDADPINRALSSANSYLYAVCQAAILAVGYSPSLGFVHTGNTLSFIYDIADLYKAETTIPAAFESVGRVNLENGSTVREKCRNKFSQYKLMPKIIKDIDKVLSYNDDENSETSNISYLWDNTLGVVNGGQNWSEE